MKNYEIEQSNNEVQKAYSQLLDKLTEHVKLLSLDSRPITSVMAMKRALIRLKIGYVEQGARCMVQGDKSMEPGAGCMGKEEEILAMEILETMGIDVKPAVCSGLIGLKEMKRTLVKYHYEKMAKGGKKYKEIKMDLSKKYGLSVSSIEKMVYRNARGMGHGAWEKQET
jgi:hypothetical protein